MTFNTGDRVHNRHTNEYARVIGAASDPEKAWIEYENDSARHLVMARWLDLVEPSEVEA